MQLFEERDCDVRGRSTGCGGQGHWGGGGGGFGGEQDGGNVRVEGEGLAPAGWTTSDFGQSLWLGISEDLPVNGLGVVVFGF